MSIVLLGYSESVLSRVLDVLHVTHTAGQIKIVQNIPVLSTMPFVPPLLDCAVQQAKEWTRNKEDTFLFGVARPVIKKILYDFFEQEKNITRINYNQLIHPSAIISDTAIYNKGLFIEPASVVTSFTQIGFGVTINRGVTIGHHCRIGDFVTINPGVHIAGHCAIGNDVQIGIGSVVFDHVSIGAGTVIGGGSVVTKDMPSGVVAWGNPCKVVKTSR